MRDDDQILEPTGLAVQPDPTPLSLIAQMVNAGAMSEQSVAVVEKLVSLQQRMEDRQAEKDFAYNFVRLQGELSTFVATKPVPDKHGNIKFYTLPFHEIMEVVRPILLRLGFSASFSTADLRDGRMRQVVTLQHESGHHRDFQVFVRVGSGPPGATESQADSGSNTTAKRLALCNALGITIDNSNDARAEGNAITAEQAATLRKMVADSRADEQAFLRFAGAKSYEEIGERRYAEVHAALEKKMGVKP